MKTPHFLVLSRQFFNATSARDWDTLNHWQATIPEPSGVAGVALLLALGLRRRRESPAVGRSFATASLHICTPATPLGSLFPE